MGCSCKVVKHVNKIEEKYGTNKLPTKKTDIRGSIKTAIKKVVIGILLIPLIPIMFGYVLIRNCFTKKAISIDKLFKLQ